MTVVEGEDLDRELVAGDQIDQHAPFGPEARGEPDPRTEALRREGENLLGRTSLEALCGCFDVVVRKE